MRAQGRGAPRPVCALVLPQAVERRGRQSAGVPALLAMRRATGADPADLAAADVSGLGRGRGGVEAVAAAFAGVRGGRLTRRWLRWR